MALFGDGERSPEDLRLFGILTGIAELFGLLAVILMCIWLSNYYGGFAFQSSLSDTYFNLHPLLMTFAFIFVFGNGILIFRVFRRISKIKVKIAHAAIHALVFFFSVIAVHIAWSGHDEDNKSKTSSDSQGLTNSPGSLTRIYKRHAGMHENEGEGSHLSSLHAWLGLSTVSLFPVQWICGLISYLYPQLRFSLRQAYMPLHVFWGAALFVLGGLSALTGIAMFSTRYAVKHKLASFNGETWIINMLGMCIVSYITSVLFILFQPSYRRVNRPEEEDKIPLSLSEMDSNE